MSRLADLTNYEVNETPNVMEVRTERLDPLSSNVNDRIYKFRLEPTGLLDANSLLQFRLEPGDAIANEQVRVNSFNGALGSIKRCTLAVGEFFLSDTEGENQIATLINFINQRRLNLNKNHAWYYGNQLVSKVDTSTGGAASEFGQFIPDDLNSGYNYSTPLANSLRIDSASTFKYGIKLGTLIPALKNIQLPLFLFDQYKIYITFEFHPASIYCNSDLNTARRASDADVKISDVQLLVDYLIFPSSVFDAMRNQTQQEGGYVLSYLNWNKVERQLTVSAGSQTSVASSAEYAARGSVQDKTTSQDFRIGMEGREVHTVVMMKKFSLLDTNLASAKVLVGQRCDGLVQESLQWEVNGVNVFPEPVSSVASQYDQCYLALGNSDLQVERPMFFNDRNSIVAGTASFASGLNGIYKPQMLDLKISNMGVVGSGTLIGRYPIVCKYTCAPALSLIAYGAGNTGNRVSYRQDSQGGTYPYDVDFFVACSRRAVIQSTAKGMTVQVYD